MESRRWGKVRVNSDEFEKALRRALATFCYAWGVLFGAMAVWGHGFLVVFASAVLLFAWAVYQVWRRF